MTLMRSLLAATAMTVLAATGLQAKTLVYCSEGSPEGFDPSPWTAGTTFDAASRPIYDRLIEFVKGGTETEPGLAESREVSEDGTEITFHLREGVKFHTTDWFTPTRDMNADDVIFSFQRQLDKDGAWYEYAPGIAWEYFNSTGMATAIKEMVRVDDHTVKFVLTRPDATILATFPMDFASIVSKEYADQLEAAGTKEQFNVLPVGTGPFTFVDYQQDAVIRYQAFADHWRGKQPIDDLIFAITVDPGVRQQKLVAGECDIIPYPNPADIEGLKANPDLTVLQQEGFNIGYLAYNTQVAPFDKVEVRKALNKAINKQAIIDAVFQGTGTAATAPLPPTSWGYNDALVDTSGLSGLTTLEQLSISVNASLVSVAGLSSLTSVKSFYLVETALTDLDELSQLTSVTEIFYINQNAALASVQGMTSLDHVGTLLIHNHPNLAPCDIAVLVGSISSIGSTN